jgi:PAS domain S-box-containing protein
MNKSPDSSLRQKAEELLKTKSSKTLSKLSEAETLKLIFELEVHQIELEMQKIELEMQKIELEMQNKELKLAKEKADTATHRYTELYNFAPIGYVILSKAGEIIDLNLIGAKMLGKTSMLLIKSMFGFFVSDNSKPIFNHFLVKVFASKVKESCELKLIVEDNSEMYIHLSGIMNENREQCFVTILDITERRQAELALKESETKFKTVADFTYDWEYWLSNENEFIYISPSCERITGYTPKDFMSNPNLFNQIIHKDDLSQFNKHHVSVIENKSSDEIDLRINTRQGEVCWINHICQPVFDEIGNYIGKRGSNRDITSRKNAENQIQKLNRDLKELNSDKDKFFSIIAHDLRSPFNGFLGYTQMMAEELSSMSIKDLQKISVLMNKTAIDLYNLLDNLLHWTRMKQGLIPFQPQKIVFADIYNDAVQVLKPNAEAKNITINYSASDQLVVFVDIDMLKTVIRNLVSNAIKFTNNGGAINIIAEQSPSDVIISVSDNGIGIPNDNIAKLFDISDVHTSTGTADEKGTGLGLLLCKEFVEKHGGKIWVESEYGKGSRFMVSLPIIG